MGFYILILRGHLCGIMSSQFLPCLIRRVDLASWYRFSVVINMMATLRVGGRPKSPDHPFSTLIRCNCSQVYYRAEQSLEPMAVCYTKGGHKTGVDM